MIELLAPAGNLEKLNWACAYGADAVYFGMENFSLRSFAGNFNFETAEKGVNNLHALNKKGYAALNIYPGTDEYGELLKTAGILADLKIDAFIAADMGVMALLKKNFPKIKIHVSTQANTVSAQTALFYADLGASRVNLARELSFEAIKNIRLRTKNKIETEVFIHGSVCFSYSGRCAISDYLASRGANKGKCAQSCRWKYLISEELRPNEYMPVFEDARGLYLFNSKDLALFRYVKKLKEIGVNSLKIEGRMKNLNYLSSVISLYRRLMDGEDISDEECLKLLYRVSNRRYSEGFMPAGKVSSGDYSFDLGKYESEAEFVGHTSSEIYGDMREVIVKGNIYAGETLERLTPDGRISEIIMPVPLLCKNGEKKDTAHSSDIILIDKDINEYTILRRVKKDETGRQKLG